jgi:hypothetical protein
LILTDKGGRIVILDRGVPPFPEKLEGRVTAAQMAADEHNAERAFFINYWHLCKLHGIYYPPSGTPEDWVHLRRLLAKHTVADLKRWSVEFLSVHGETLLDKGYHHHLRLFSAWLKEPG